jgi:hypothetical protein
LRRLPQPLTFTAAIWSLCVSKPDLVTHILDIEKDSDQIAAQLAEAGLDDGAKGYGRASPRGDRRE